MREPPAVIVTQDGGLVIRICGLKHQINGTWKQCPLPYRHDDECLFIDPVRTP